MVVIGFASGDIPKMATNYLLLKSASAVGFFWGNYGARGHPFFMESIAAVTKLLAEKRISPEVSDTFTLDKVGSVTNLLINQYLFFLTMYNARIFIMLFVCFVFFFNR